MRIQGGVTEAQTELFYLFSPKFYNSARLRGLSYEDAQDVVQVTFNRIFEKIDTYQEARQSGVGWMQTICDHVIIDVYRSKASSAKKLDKLKDTKKEALRLKDENPVHSSFERKERIEAFNRAWNSISEEDRLTIHSRLYRYENPNPANRAGKRGPPGRKYEEAKERLRQEYRKYLKQIE